MTTKTSEVSVSSSKILWVDDEIDLLKSNIMFLRQKGFDVSEVNNGEDAIALILTENFDLVFMDEMMPGMGGLEALVKIKEIKPNLPVVMVTKNETETLMEEAIGQKISDYLIKPVNPTQVLLVCKKILESKRIKGNTVSRDYILEFNKISALLYENPTWSEWIDIYNKLTNREIEIDTHPELGLKQMLTDQKKECNVEFSKFIENEYVKWVNGFDDKPTLSHEIMEKYVFPELPDYDSVFFFVVDCMRLDQWLMMEKFLHPYFDIKKDYYYSLLPTATPYSRNAIFAGLYPSDIEKHYSDLWKADDDLENSKNNFEKEFLQKLIDRKRIKLRNELRYTKIMDSDFSRGIESKILSFSGSHLNGY